MSTPVGAELKGQLLLVLAWSVNPFPHCTFDVAHLTAELQISPPQKDDIMQNEDDSEDVTGADL